MMMSLVAAFSPFRFLDARNPQRFSLDYPLSPAPRVFVLDFEMRRERNVVCLPAWRAELKSLQDAEAIACTFDVLLELADLVRMGKLRLPRLQFPLIVVTRPDSGSLSGDDHRRLWAEFRVPVLEQIRTAEGKLAAFECEARDGFHVADASVAIPGARPIVGPCSCGLDTPRITVPSRTASRPRPRRHRRTS